MNSLMRIPQLALIGLLLMPWQYVGAQQNVYRCVDSAGKATFQSQPCPGDNASKRLEITGKDASRRSNAVPGAQKPADAYVDGAEPAPAAVPADRAMRSLNNAPGWEGHRPAASSDKAQFITTKNSAASAGLERLGEGADVIVVSGYEFQSRSTRLQINHPNKPVMLVLSSYHATQWNIQVAAGTHVKAIIVAAYELMPAPVANGEFRVIKDDLPHATRPDSAEFRQLLATLHKRYGVRKIAGFHGAYKLPEIIGASGPYPNDPNFTLEGVRPEKARVEMSFTLFSTDGRALPWTNSGPQGGKRYNGVVSGASFVRNFPSGPTALGKEGVEAYALGGNGSTLNWYPQGLTQTPQKIALPANMPELSWGSGLAWDTKKGELAIISFGGEGYFYRYDTRQRRWLGARSLQNRDLAGLSFDAATGRYASLSRAVELVIFDSSGALEEVHPLNKALLDLASVMGSSGPLETGLSVVLTGKLAALVHVSNGTVTHIWTYDLERRSAQLTYKP